MENVKFYSAPALELIDCESEGILCASSEGSFTDYDEINW